MSILLRVSGRWACFSRPELKVETVTYDVMTPNAAKAVLGAIYWKPEINWVIDGIYVLKQPETMTYMVNCIKEKISPKSKPMDITLTSNRDQRNITVLRNVEYVINAHFNIISGEDNSGKHLDIFRRRVERGQCYRCPYFGIRDYSVEEFDLLDKPPVSPLKGVIKLGYMLHSINFDNCQPSFFNAVLKDGYMEIPPMDSSEVKK